MSYELEHNKFNELSTSTLEFMRENSRLTEIQHKVIKDILKKRSEERLFATPIENYSEEVLESFKGSGCAYTLVSVDKELNRRYQEKQKQLESKYIHKSSNELQLIKDTTSAESIEYIVADRILSSRNSCVRYITINHTPYAKEEIFKTNGNELSFIPFGEAKKESKDKQFYELDWEFIEEMAKRMSAAKKDKYPVFNWHKPIDPASLTQSLIRHTVEIVKGNLKDEDQEYGHLLAVACNAMMIWYQYKHNNG